MIRGTTYFILSAFLIAASCLYAFASKIQPYASAEESARQFFTAFDGKSLRQGFNSIPTRESPDLYIKEQVPSSLRAVFDEGPVERVTSLDIRNIPFEAFAMSNSQDGMVVSFPFKLDITLPLTNGSAHYEGTIQLLNNNGWKVTNVQGIVDAKVGKGNLPYLLPPNAREPYTNSHYVAPVTSIYDFMFPMLSSASAHFAEKVLAGSSSSRQVTIDSNGSGADGPTREPDNIKNVSHPDFTQIRKNIENEFGVQFSLPNQGVESFDTKVDGVEVNGGHLVDPNDIPGYNFGLEISGKGDLVTVEDLMRKALRAVDGSVSDQEMNEIMDAMQNASNNKSIAEFDLRDANAQAWHVEVAYVDGIGYMCSINNGFPGSYDVAEDLSND